MSTCNKNENTSSIYTITLNSPIYIDVFVKNLPKRYRTSVSNELVMEGEKVKLSEKVSAPVAESVIYFNQNNTSLKAVKKISISNEMILSSDPVSSKVPIYPVSNELIFDSSITITGSRERTLSDMDNYPLEEFDDLTLQKTDTIIK